MKITKWLSTSTVASVMLVTGLNTQAMQPKSDIVDTAIAAGNFSTLVTAVQAADLVDTLKGEGPFTVFAPTDEAFAKIPAEKLNALLANKEQLAAVLTYHVVPGKVMSGDVVSLDSAATVQGQSVEIEVKSGKVFIDNAMVSAADIETSNGVIHVIDTVILPDQVPECGSIVEGGSRRRCPP